LSSLKLTTTTELGKAGGPCHASVASVQSLTDFTWSNNAPPQSEPPHLSRRRWGCFTL